MTADDPRGLTERQQKWLASARAGLERETGRSLEDWAEIARACPETRPRARALWLKQHHGLGQTRAALVLEAAFPAEAGWSEPDALRAALWRDAGPREIFEAVERAATALPGVVVGQRKGYTAFSRATQFAAAKPVKGGVLLGLALRPDADPSLEPPRNESWSERLQSRRLLTGPDEVDAALAALLTAAWARS